MFEAQREAAVAAAKAAVEVARAKLDQATVRAPGPGRVLVRSVEPGQIVQAGKTAHACNACASSATGATGR